EKERKPAPVAPKDAPRVPEQAPRMDGAKEDTLEFRWSSEKASLGYSTKKHLPDYEVELVRPKEFDTPINIRTKPDRKLIYSITDGHLGIVFARAKDALYIAEYSPIGTGCEVVALDLKTGKQLWKSRLKGIASDNPHSKYRN